MIWSEKLGQEIGTYNSLGGLRINPKPFRQSTQNTTVTCYMCKGWGANALTHPNGLVTLNPCVLCKGKRRRSNRVV